MCGKSLGLKKLNSSELKATRKTFFFFNIFYTYVLIYFTISTTVGGAIHLCCACSRQHYYIIFHAQVNVKLFKFSYIISFVLYFLPSFLSTRSNPYVMHHLTTTIILSIVYTTFCVPLHFFNKTAT